MAVPDFQSLMLPVLEAAADGEISASDLRNRVAAAVNLTVDDFAEKLPNGGQTVFANRVAWANIHLQRAGLIDKIGYGRYRVSSTGSNILAEHPAKIDLKFLHRFPAYTQWRAGGANGDTLNSPKQTESVVSGESIITPEEQMATSYRVFNAALQNEILDRVREMSPAFFEHLVIELLIKLGYGGGQPEMGKVTGRSGDGGIDGVIKEDALGLDIIYVQAKRYGSGHSVGQPEMRDFAGSLDGEGATKGIFITTGSFGTGAREYASRIPKRIILIDGLQLAELMVERKVGVVVSASYEIKKIDENYFVET